MNDDWWSDPKLWIMAGGIVVQAGIVWWRVGEQGARIAALETQMDSVREWRAQAREQIRNLRDDQHEQER